MGAEYLRGGFNQLTCGLGKKPGGYTINLFGAAAETLYERLLLPETSYNKIGWVNKRLNYDGSTEDGTKENVIACVKDREGVLNGCYVKAMSVEPIFPCDTTRLLGRIVGEITGNVALQLMTALNYKELIVIPLADGYHQISCSKPLAKCEISTVLSDLKRPATIGDPNP